MQRVKAEAKTASGLFLPESSVKELNEARVLAVGPGGLDKDGKRTPMGVTTGDRVLIPQVSSFLERGMGKEAVQRKWQRQLQTSTRNNCVLTTLLGTNSTAARLSRLERRSTICSEIASKFCHPSWPVGLRLNQSANLCIPQRRILAKINE